MDSYITSLMTNLGYFGMFLGMVLEAVIIIIPSELILTFGGFMTLSTNMTVIGVILVSTLGSLLGAIVLYLIGKILNKDRLIKIVESKYGRLLRVKRKDIEMADKWFLEKGTGTVFFCKIFFQKFF